MKHIRIIILLLTGIFSGTYQVGAQDKKIEFFGSGRFAFTNSTLSGRLIDSDTTTARRQMTGNTLFDMGFHIRPSENTEIKAITRVQNDLNGFWGGGVTLGLRELYLRGLIFNRITYHVGDINTRMSEYTLYNNACELQQFNPKALGTFMEVINYDKFYGNNSWRQQGAKADFGFDFKKIINHLHFTGLITKNRQTDYFTTPDRLFSGGTVHMKAFNQLNLSYHYVNVFDVKNSAMFSNALFNNKVHSFEWSETRSIKGHHVLIGGELGQSTVSFENNPNAPSALTGTFNDIKLQVTHKNKNWHAGINLRTVETSFRSMGAQSRRVDFGAAASEYPYYTNRESLRPVTMLSILTDGNYYNMFLSPTLFEFNPVYENILPYGKATPNRQGGDIHVTWNSKNEKLIRFNSNASFYKEITGQGTTAIRSFTQADASVNIGINEIYKGKKLMQLGLYARQQNTSRNGTEGIDKVDLKSTQIKCEFNYELIPNLELQVATLILEGTGNEYLAQRNAFNEIFFYKSFNADLRETIYIGGLNYQFSKYNCLKIQYQQAEWNNKLLANNQYIISRLAVLYNLFF